jgi:large subunit ribosomal protein L21
MKYAIVKINGHQYKVAENQEIKVDSMPLKENEEILIKEVMLVVEDDNSVKIGTPYLEEGLKAKVIAHTKGEKIRVARFHAKARFRKVTGFRASLTTLLIAPKTVVKKEKVKVKKESIKK